MTRRRLQNKRAAALKASAASHVLICLKVVNSDGIAEKTIRRYVSPVVPRIGESVVIASHPLIGVSHMEVVDVCHHPVSGPLPRIAKAEDGVVYVYSALVYVAVAIPAVGGHAN